ncbi:MAG: M28 family peptidase [Chitinivibrionales bacterium]|nr:M28 family peptidase [Chitinivibrionales bacterium]
MKKLLFTLCIMCCITAANAQITALSDKRSTTFQTAEKTFSNTIKLGPDMLLVCGETKQTTGGQLIDAWDNSYTYYLLFPIRGGNRELVSTLGSIIFEYQGIILLKAIQIDESEQLMQCYELMILRNESIRLSQPAIVEPENKIPPRNTVIQDIVNKINGDSISNTISKLQGMERYYSGSYQSAATYLEQKLKSYGLRVYQQKAGSQPNIVAAKLAAKETKECLLLGGHWDAVNQGYPAADDNGSGTAGVVEAARVLSTYSFEKNLLFVCFANEEHGMTGSSTCADSLKKANVSLLGMLNLDMIAYLRQGATPTAYIFSNASSQTLFTEYQQAAKQYVNGLNTAKGTGSISSQSDHSQFWSKGFPAIFMIEQNDIGSLSPYLHKADDKLGNSANSMDLAKKITAACAALLATKANVAATGIQRTAHLPHQNGFSYRISGSASECNLHMSIDPNIRGLIGVRLYSLQGRQIASYKLNAASSTSVPLPHLACGIYQISINSWKESIRSQLVVSR